MVNEDTVFENTWSLIYNTLKDGVTDPIGSRKWVYASFPETTSVTYPILVVNNPDIPTMRGMNYSKNMYRHVVMVLIELYDSQAIRLDTLASEIYKALKNANSTFRGEGLHNMSINSGTNSPVERNGKVAHMRNIRVGFDFTA